MNSCKEYGLPTPKIEEQNDFIDFEIIRPELGLNTINTEIRTITNDYERLSLEKQTILLYILNHKSITRKEASFLLKSKSQRRMKF